MGKTLSYNLITEEKQFELGGGWGGGGGGGQYQI